VSGRLFPLGDDWYEWHQEPPLAAQVLVQVTAGGDGRLGLTGLRIVGEPTSGLLRAIPLGRIEATANAQLSVIDDAVTAAPRHRRSARHPAQDPASSPGGDDGWEQPDVPPEAARSRPARGRPDRFYLDIARAYGELAGTSRRPAAELADRHDVPVTTVHRWIKEARRRGHLSPGRPGKAG
jgi:hypothetical protein